MPRRVLLVLVPVLVLGAGAAYLWGELDPLRLDAVLARRDALRAAAEADPALALLAFLAVYFAAAVTALPLGPAMSLLAGSLFGRWVGTAAIMAGALAAALVVFAAARSALGPRLARRAGPLYGRVAAELRADAFGYLLFARLTPGFPYFLVNVVAGMFRVPVRVFALATALGRLPATFLYVSLGESLGTAANADALLSPAVLGSLAGLGFLALAPVAARAVRRRRSGRRPPGP